MNAQHSISNSIMIEPKIATSVIYSQHIQIWQNLHSVFIVIPIVLHRGFQFPFLENLDIGIFVIHILSRGKLEKM